jgi:hypothetical protein
MIMATIVTRFTPDVEYLHWLEEIDFYKGELKKMNRQLELFIPTFYSQDFAACVEQFQNRFIRQHEVIDILRHNVKAHENQIQRLHILPTPALREMVEKAHGQLRDEVIIFIGLFIELEQDFNDFLA